MKNTLLQIGVLAKLTGNSRAMEITFGLAAGSGYLSATATAAAHAASAAAAVASAAPAASAASGALLPFFALPASAIAAVGVAGALAFFWMSQAAPQAQKHCRANRAKLSASGKLRVLKKTKVHAIRERQGERSMQPKKRKIQSTLPTLLRSQTEIAPAGEKLRQEELLGSGAFAAVYFCSLDGQSRAKKVVSDIAQFEAEQKALEALSGYDFIVQLFQASGFERTAQMCFTVHNLRTSLQTLPSQQSFFREALLLLIAKGSCFQEGVWGRNRAWGLLRRWDLRQTCLAEVLCGNCSCPSYQPFTNAKMHDKFRVLAGDFPEHFDSGALR